MQSITNNCISTTEEIVLAQLSFLKQQIIALHTNPAKLTHDQLSEHYAAKLEQLAAIHRSRKENRDRRRHQAQTQRQGADLEAFLTALQRESQQDGLEKRRLKQERKQALFETAQQLLQADKQVEKLKQQYAQLSKEWQAAMQRAYFSTLADKEYSPLCVLYQDEFLMVVDKPAGLLSVPGRRLALQDSTVSRLRYERPAGSFLQAVHRLDCETSGLLAIALTPQAHAALSQQFAQRQVYKTYEAILSKPIARPAGTLSLPLRPDPELKPKQTVDFAQGKPSQTAFKQLVSGHRPRVELIPKTGRTHQLRVHAAHPKGLNAPILGDALYGDSHTEERLHLHATQLAFVHPVTKEQIKLESAAPF